MRGPATLTVLNLLGSKRDITLSEAEYLEVRQDEIKGVKFIYIKHKHDQLGICYLLLVNPQLNTKSFFPVNQRLLDPFAPS